MKRVLVLGGTGHLGSAIVRRLDIEGYAVTAAGLRSGRRANLDGCGAERVHGDDRDPRHLDAWMKGAEIVVDTATPYPLTAFGGAGEGDPVRNALNRAETLIAAVRRENAHLVHISSFTTLDSAGGSAARLKDAIIHGVHPYFDVKERVERKVSGAFQDGLQGCIVNPAVCFGPWDMKPPEMCFIPLLLTGKVPALVRRTINIIDVRDVALAVAAEIRCSFPHRQIVLSGHNIQVDELAEQICALGEARLPSLRGSALIGAAGLFWTETLFAVAGKKSPWPSLPMLLTAVSRAMEQSPEQRALDISPCPVAETLRDAVNWYRSIGYC